MTAPTLAVPGTPEVAEEGPVDLTALAHALAAGTQLLVGQYRVELATGHWWWSDEIYVMHGRTPGEVDPSVEFMRSRKHPDDRNRLSRAATVALRTGQPFACGHRIVDQHGRTHTVVVTGQGRRGQDSTKVTEIAGYVMDVTPVLREALEREAEHAVSRAFVTAAAVEQAKGAIMALRGVDDVTARAILGDAAAEASTPISTAGAQVMESLAKSEASDEVALKEALAGIHPVERPRGHEAQLARRRVRADG